VVAIGHCGSGLAMEEQLLAATLYIGFASRG